MQAPPPSQPASGLGRWFNPSTAPFIPIPEVGTDPNSGTTVGLIPAWLQTDEDQDIRRIIAPDVLHNTYFGYGMHGRVYAYPSADEQWSVTGGIKERVERSFIAQLQRGLQRERRWSINTTLLYDRDGTPRFFGIGNNSAYSSQTNFTDQQALLQAQVGLNLNHAWQLQYTARLRVVDVLPGTLPGIPSIETRFPGITGLGTSTAMPERLAIAYDTRDDLTVPRSGAEWVTYAGVASRGGLLNDSLYSETGVDGRGFWPLAPDTVLAAHTALRYLPSADRLPFWALSCIGGESTEIGGTQPLRGYGAGRFCDRNSFSASAELRQRVLSMHVISTHVEVELTPFVDVGRVFEGMGTWPLTQLHKIGGIGFRGLARPFVVGYVDVGYGNEGAAVFTGLNYPF
jgi:outer membrane protein assembly factor BamA